MSELTTTDDTAQLEEDLRRLYATVTAPPVPAGWTSSPARIASRPHIGSRGWRGPRRVGAVAVAVAAALVVAILANRSPFAPQPVLAVQLQPAGASLQCKLPISALSEDHTSGFIVMSHGHATFQPVQTKGTTYIPALGVWAGVLPQMVAPDGRAYVSENYTSAGHLIISITDARGTRPLLDTTAPALIEPFAYAANGSILVEDHSRPAGSAPGPLPYWNLKRLDPVTGKLDALPVTDPALPRADSEAGYNQKGNAISYIAFAANGATTVSAFDMATGRMTEWFNSNDATGTAQFVGTDSEGSPIIQVAERDIWHTNPVHRSGIAIQTMLLTSPHHITLLNHGRAGDPGVAGAFSPLSATMGNDVWLASDDGAIWLYRTGVGLQQIAKLTTSNQGAPGVAISGPCQ